MQISYYRDHSSYYTASDISANKHIAAMSYFMILFFLPLIACPHSRYARFHANQSLLLLGILLLGNLLLGVVKFVLRLFFLGAIASLIMLVFRAIMLCLFAYGFFNAVKGRAVEMPFIGGIRIIKE